MNGQNDYTDEIVGIISVFDGEVPYLKRGPNAKLYPGKWCIPSGHIKRGETAEQAARRELEEETGYKVPDSSNMRELGRFTYAAETKGKTLTLNIRLFLNVTDEKPEIHLCDEHTDARYISIDILSDDEKLFLYTHARGVSDFTPIDRTIIDEYMPKAYDIYKATTNRKIKSIA